MKRRTSNIQHPDRIRPLTPALSPFGGEREKGEPDARQRVPTPFVLLPGLTGQGASLRARPLAMIRQSFDPSTFAAGRGLPALPGSWSQCMRKIERRLSRQPQPRFSPQRRLLSYIASAGWSQMENPRLKLLFGNTGPRPPPDDSQKPHKWLTINALPFVSGRSQNFTCMSSGLMRLGCQSAKVGACYQIKQTSRP